MKTLKDIVSECRMEAKVFLTERADWPNNGTTMDKFRFSLVSQSPRFSTDGTFSSGVAHRVATKKTVSAIHFLQLLPKVQAEFAGKIHVGDRLSEFQKLLAARSYDYREIAKEFEPALPSVETLFASCVDDAMCVDGYYDVDSWARDYCEPTTKVSVILDAFNTCQKLNRILRGAFGDKLDEIVEIARN